MDQNSEDRMEEGCFRVSIGGQETLLPLEYIPVDRITFNKSNPRREGNKEALDEDEAIVNYYFNNAAEKKSAEELKSSIKKVGLNKALIVWKRKDDLYLIVDGERRGSMCKRAIKEATENPDLNTPAITKLMEKGIPCYVFPENITQKQFDQYMAQEHSNSQKSWKAYQRAKLFITLHDVHNMTSEDIANENSTSITEVDRKMDCAKIVDIIGKEVKDARDYRSFYSVVYEIHKRNKTAFENKELYRAFKEGRIFKNQDAAFIKEIFDLNNEQAKEALEALFACEDVESSVDAAREVYDIKNVSKESKTGIKKAIKALTSKQSLIENNFPAFRDDLEDLEELFEQFKEWRAKRKKRA